MLFGRKSEKDRLKKDIGKLMNKYDKRDIDGATYMKEMLDLTSSYQNKKKKK